MAQLTKSAIKLLMCRPTHYSVEYSINPWMNVQNQADKSLSMKQWNTLKDTITQCGAEVAVMESEKAHSYPDIVFTANAAVVRGQTAYLSNFRFKERKGEYVFYGNWFRANGYYTSYNEKITHEGTGDALWAGKGYNVLFSGIGPRSDENATADIQKVLSTEEEPIQVKGVRLIDPRFYHLDTCFCPLSENLAIWYPKAFDEKAKQTFSQHLELIPVSEDEATKFACNAVVIGKNVIMHEGSENIAKTLEKAGYTVHFVNMSQFIKAGGSAKCCTLRIE